MADEMKSALDIAMEKLKKLETDEEKVPLTKKQKQKIADIKKNCEAKIAEKEIMIKSRLKKLPPSADPTELREQIGLIQQEFIKEKAHLEKERDRNIEKVRQQKS
jgi:hypothetical protein